MQCGMWIFVVVGNHHVKTRSCGFSNENNIYF